MSTKCPAPHNYRDVERLAIPHPTEPDGSRKNNSDLDDDG